MRSPPTATPVAALAVLVLWLGAPSAARAQHEGHGAMPDDSTSARHPTWHLMAQAIPVVTRAQNSATGMDLTEGYVAQAAAMARGDFLGGRLRIDATLNGEGLTMERGELSTGAFGEGYVDRRHPHTYLHEAMVSALGSVGPVRLSASAGRGFAPFGTDDPMVRPFEKYPINHHLSQILERGLVMAAARLGPLLLEGGAFSGAEPSSPRSLPRIEDVGDSWSVRGTLLPHRGVELQASYARVTSPEQAGGFGLDQRKRSVSARAISPDGARYVLAEWARTVERDDDRQVDVFGYETALIEGAASIGAFGVGLRLEQTDRPEEERLSDPFRTPRPAPDLGISGITRWRAASMAVTLPKAVGPVRAAPFVELTWLSARSRNAASVFRPQEFYGTTTPWMATVGARVAFGRMHGRMGRYGAALENETPIRMLAALDEEGSARVHR